MTRIAHLDYEGRSGVDITDVGSHRWSIDPRFDLFMASVSRDDEAKVHLWINPKFFTADWPGHENAEAEKILAEAEIVFAHNAPNEMANTWGALEQKKACPFKRMPPVEVWRCSAAMARKAGLPHALEPLCDALNLPVRKDKKGKALIRFFCIPDAETGLFNEPRDHPDKWNEFCAYCITDNDAERAAGKKLKAFELTGAALATFQFDLRMNQRGIPINVTAARNAQQIIDETQVGVVEEFRALTGLNPTQREKVRVMVELDNMQADTVQDEIERLEAVLQEDGLMGCVDADDLRNQRILKMFQLVSYAAVKKIQTMLDCVCPDGRVRGAHMYYGAGPGRWSSKLLQVQNFKKTDRFFKNLTGHIYGCICRGYPAWVLHELYGEPLECIANSIRHFIQADGEILDGDYNAIEGRIGVWIAGQDDIVEAWRRGEDLYKRAVAFVNQVPEASIGSPSPERDFGKVIELAAQFGLGAGGFMRTCDNWGLPCDEEKAERAIHEYYRPTHRKVVDRWWAHDKNMRAAIRNPGVTHGIFTVRKLAGMTFMLMRLPSGRSIAYPDPQIEKREPTADEIEAMENGKEFGPERFQQITYWGLVKGVAWGRVRLWGSLAFQNEVQGTAADFMAHGASVAEQRGMAPFMLVHDQGLAIRAGGHTPEDYERALGDLPAWAKGFPMKVECKLAPYYRK